MPEQLGKSFSAQLNRARGIHLVGQILDKQVAVFGKTRQAHQKVILNRLGWLDVFETIQPEIGRVERLVSGVRKDGFRHVLVLGMGGSSLCPEVLGEIFGRKRWLKSYDVVDTTAPSQLADILEKVDLHKTFIIVSSKSGSTIETMSQYRFFFKLIKESRPLKAGDYFAAVTDEGSKLHRIARRNRFREIFLNPADIGGRYSALSYFGLVPGAFTAADPKRLLEAGSQQLGKMKKYADDCDALKLGLLLGTGAKEGYDRVRFVTGKTMAPFIAWIEQLLAESTGKENRGIIPVDATVNGGKPSGEVLNVYYTLKGEREPERPEIGRPHVVIEVSERAGIGAEMMKWEMATAVASTVLGVNPFDEPNVAESKKNAAAVLKTRRGPRKEAPLTPLASFDRVDIISLSAVKGMERRRQIKAEELLSAFLDNVQPQDYLAILCYTERDRQMENRVASLGAVIARKFGIVTLCGFGPRYLHSTGQLFKGGSQKGHFLVLDREYENDFDIPTTNISFGRLIKAQAQGDVKALRKRRRPIVHMNLRHDPAHGISELEKLMAGL